MLVTLVSILAVAASANLVDAKNATSIYCSGRGGCTCDCSWANPNSCQHDDGSCCYGCCCSAPPVPPPPGPGPGPGPGPSPGGSQYCPSANDIVAAYGSPNIFNGGWSITGGGAAATKASFNLLGGSVEYDIDLSHANTGVNANIYTISPTGISGWTGFNQGNYCDGAKTGGDWCVEVDWIESNGNCGGQTTLHTVAGSWGSGCNAGGCANSYTYNGASSFHMKVTFGTDGSWTTCRDWDCISMLNLSPMPGGSDVATLVKYYSGVGAVIYSSQWQGWVPVASCGGGGDLQSSSFKISNLRIIGTVVQGPTPTAC